MNALRTNKRGEGLVLVGIIILLLGLSVFTLVPSQDFRDNPIGIKQYEILYQNEQANAASNYLQESSVQAANIADKKTFQTAGQYRILSESGELAQTPCKDFFYPLYTAPDDVECLPDFKQTYKEYYLSTMDKFISSYKPKSLAHSFNMNFDQKELELDVSTLGTENIYIPLRKSSEELFSSNYEMQDEVVDVSRYPTGLLGSYGNEKIVSCTTGQCLADVARYYLEQYSSNSQNGLTLPYVYGGESPYTYEDTLKDRDTHGKESFFYGVSLTKNQVGKYSYLSTQPGFDCSGFAWWAGKHAGVPLFTYRLTADEYYNKAKLSSEKICDKLIDGTCDLSLLQQNIRPGDVVFYSQDNKKMSHISIYVGEGNVIHSNPKGLTQNPLLELKNLIAAVYRPNFVSVGIKRLGQDNLEPVFATQHKIATFTDSLTTNQWTAYLNTKDLGTITDIHSTGSLINSEKYLQTIEQGSYSDIIIYAGLEELYSSSDLDLIKEKLQKIFTTAKKSETKVIVLTLPPSKGHLLWSEKISDETTDLNDWIKNTATDIDLIIDSYSQLENPKNKTSQLLEYVDVDKIHPNVQGVELLGELIYDKAFSVNSYANTGTCDPLVDPAQLNKDAMRYTPDFEAMNKVLHDSGLEEYIQEAHKRFPKVPVPVIKAFMMTEMGSENTLQKYIDKTALDSKGNLCNSYGYCGVMQVGKSACDSVKTVCNYKELQKGNPEANILAGTAFLNLLIEKYFDSGNIDYYFLGIAYDAGPGSMNNIKKVASLRLNKPVELIRWGDIIYSDVENGMKKNSASWAHKKAKWDEIYSYPNIIGSVLIQACGIDSFYSNSQKTTQNHISFTPQTHAVDKINLDSMDLIKQFIKTARFECKENTKECILEQVKQFNEDNKGKITLAQGGEEDEIVYDILSQLLSQYKLNQQDCITKIQANYSLQSRFNKTVIYLYSTGEVYAGSAKNFADTKKYITTLPFNPTTTFNKEIVENNVVTLLIDKTKKEMRLGTKEIDEGWLWDSVEDVYWSTGKENSDISHVDSLALLKLASSQQVQSLTQTHSDLIGPASWCTGEEGLPKVYADRINTPAWNSEGKTYAEIALLASQETGIDPALLITHSIWKSNMGLKDTCHDLKKSSLTGCGWSSTCSEGCGCESETKQFDSDLDQLKCSANVDKTAYLQAISGTSQGNPALVDCSIYAQDPNEMWDCILFDETNNQNDKNNFKKTYCQWSNYFNEKGFETSDQIESENACYGAVEYAKKYLGTKYGGTGTCRAEDATSGKCSTQCGSFVSNVFKFGFKEGETSETIRGNGNQKCDQSSTSQQKFSDPLLLQPGDLFTADGPSAAAQKWGHTGIFVGFGKVQTDARTSTRPGAEPYCYKEFIPDPSGEPVFIHSVGPVCYSTLSQLQKRQHRNILSFCRPDFCGKLDYTLIHDDSKTSSTRKQIIDSPLQWIPYKKDYENLVCRSGQPYYRFSASFPFTDKKVFFSLFIQNNEEVDIYSPKIEQELCNSQNAFLVSWETSVDADPYSFTMNIASFEDEETIFIQKKLFENGVTVLDTKPTTISQKNKLFKFSTSDKDIYYYLFDNDTFEQKIPLGKESHLFISSTNEYGVKNSDNLWISFTPKTKGEILLKSATCLNFKSWTITRLLEDLGYLSLHDYSGAKSELEVGSQSYQDSSNQVGGVDLKSQSSSVGVNSNE